VGYAANVLAPLSALQQLTSLQLGYSQKRQLQHVLLPQLRELEMRLESVAHEELQQQLQQQLQLTHLTGLSKLFLRVSAALLQPGDYLPPNLHELEVTGAGVQHCTLQPLLWLTQLQKLHVLFDGVPVESEVAVQHLSSLTSLQEQRLSYAWNRDAAEVGCGVPWQGSLDATCEAAAAASAWQDLPLTSLSWRGPDVPGAVLRKVAALTGLTSLQLNTQERRIELGFQAEPRQLAAIPQQLTRLRQLSMVGFFSPLAVVIDGRMADTAGHLHDMESVAALLQAIGELQMLEEVHLSLPVWLHECHVQQLSGKLQQLMPDHLLPYCSVTAGGISLMV
jgi:hypothetical protein